MRTAPPLKGSFVDAVVSQIWVSRAMLRISRMSREELTITVEECLVPNVRALKQHLNQWYGLPPCFRQRLLLHGQCLQDTATLQPGMELELVMLAFIPNGSSGEVEFTAAAGTGDFDKARALTRSTLPHARW